MYCWTKPPRRRSDYLFAGRQVSGPTPAAAPFARAVQDLSALRCGEPWQPTPDVHVTTGASGYISFAEFAHRKRDETCRALDRRRWGSRGAHIHPLQRRGPVHHDNRRRVCSRSRCVIQKLLCQVWLDRGARSTSALHRCFSVGPRPVTSAYAVCPRLFSAGAGAASGALWYLSGRCAANKAHTSDIRSQPSCFAPCRRESLMR